jgi:hypothetical protein
VIAFRGYIVTLAACLAAEFGIYYGLAALDVRSGVGLGILMIWLCVTCLLTGLIGGHFYPEEDDDRGD